MLSCAAYIFIDANNLGSLLVPSMMVFSFTVATSGWMSIFNIFSDILKIVFFPYKKNGIYACHCMLLRLGARNEPKFRKRNVVGCNCAT